MGFLARWRIHKKVAADGQVEVSEKDGVRRMHFGTETVQSAMRVDDPYALEIGYTRSMMAHLLFHPDPREYLMIGLGGGSTAKWVYRNLPAARTTVVELNPEVLRIARGYFHVPPDDARLRILIGDGAEYLCNNPPAYDVILVDGYDEFSQAAALGTPEFYANCRAALKPNGVLAVNLWGSDPLFHGYVEAISKQFDGLILCLPAEQRGNIIVFGLVRSPNMPKWDELRAIGRQLESQYGLEFVRFVEGFRKMNLHNDKRLLV
jgi:spermidine synthase